MPKNLASSAQAVGAATAVARAASFDSPPSTARATTVRAPRTDYSHEFRRSAVQLVERNGKRAIDVSRSLCINVKTLANWMSAADAGKLQDGKRHKEAAYCDALGVSRSGLHAHKHRSNQRGLQISVQLGFHSDHPSSATDLAKKSLEQTARQIHVQGRGNCGAARLATAPTTRSC